MADNWALLQTLGDKPVSELVDGDVVSAVEFDEKGDYLATGDRGGRIRIYEKQDGTASSPTSSPSSSIVRRTLSQVSSGGPPSPPNGMEYKLWHEFQSHEAEFDYLKSLEIEEKINCLRWCKPLTSAFLLLTTNDKTIKLWRVQDRRKPTAVIKYQDKKSINTSAPSKAKYPLLLPPKMPYERGIVAKPRRVFANGHAYHINSISLNSDNETFISADDLRINLWNLAISDTSFNIVDIKPANMEELTEVITAATCHPQHSNIFLWSNSRGSIRMADTRSQALCDNHAKLFEEEEDPSRRSFFSEIISSINDVKFSKDGRHILSRDYMSLKLWDVNMESKPIRTIYVHEQLRSKLCDLYENDAIFDKFQCAFSGDARWLMTGSYHNFFHIYDRIGRGDACIECVKTPKKKPPSRSRLNLPRPKAKPDEGIEMDLDKKVLHCSWHPTDPMLAVGVLNNVFVYHYPNAQPAR
mmetsp:Transcript_38794/g.91624  ORF Transcript_38794/g.91624 Transcript_38794/m.91624 type:complete len:469 (+) Transcript_38794:203-1609(+)|eukprot:CAMPEP_0177701862 /NCGR_PEP_ID=MMETSP0484_2-20121128/6833_1 /TAXON_ID=354590 /ORGANISM="Rhodomonas lens, Strain RHODO" /LENGTH=468 /DNA_ID=CAMNT_0019213115 /DNA_START=196 /DNA_END=1602 /DNA_ORIENTATION=-